MNGEQLFEYAVHRIEAAYADLGHELGWRFLTTPRRTLSSDARVALITLNPGGTFAPPDQGKASSEVGSAYQYERWANCPPGESPLQRQLLALLDALHADPDETLSAYYVPFRSPSLKSLPRRAESFAFADGLWRDILREVRPELVVCSGPKPFRMKSRGRRGNRIPAG